MTDKELPHLVNEDPGHSLWLLSSQEMLISSRFQNKNNQMQEGLSSSLKKGGRSALFKWC